MPKSTELKKKITLIYRGTLIGNIQVVKSGNILRKKSCWPVTLSFNAKRHGSNGYKMLKVVSVFSNVIASLIISHVLK